MVETENFARYSWLSKEEAVLDTAGVPKGEAVPDAAGVSVG